ncbi:hypothetical protein BHE74_00000817 [Ensete ventricosum]|nr:hypothetical protein BHE74_00000817 [Ensete ventricosum]
MRGGVVVGEDPTPSWPGPRRGGFPRGLERPRMTCPRFRLPCPSLSRRGPPQQYPAPFALNVRAASIFYRRCLTVRLRLRHAVLGAHRQKHSRTSETSPCHFSSPALAFGSSPRFPLPALGMRYSLSASFSLDWVDALSRWDSECLCSGLFVLDLPHSVRSAGM